jgi:predicted DNA-binding transcriptional regulator AlpA
MDATKKYHLDKRSEQTAAEIGASDPPDRLYTIEEVAEKLGVSKQWLDIKRSKGGGPRFCRVGRSIRYLNSHLIEFLEQRSALSTAEYQHRAGPGRPKAKKKGRKS